MNRYIKGFTVLVLGIFVTSLSSCATCGTSYRRELSKNPNFAEANVSYKKAIRWLDKAECSFAPKVAVGFYRTGESYLSDTIYKLKEQENNNHINVSEDVNYCEQIKSETDVKIGQAENAKP
jgi:hypothetical protein